MKRCLLLSEGVQLPGWFGVGTAFPFGVLMTGADLPNASPYFIAIERMIDADISATLGVPVLAVYAVVLPGSGEDLRISPKAVLAEVGWATPQPDARRPEVVSFF